MTEVQITPQDIAEGDDLDFEEKQEHWNTYRLNDGTILKIRLILTGVKRLKKYRPDGQPLYIVNSQNVVRAVNIPEKLMQKPKEQTIKPA